MTHNQRTLLAFILSFSIIFAWQTFVAPPHPVKPQTEKQETDTLPQELDSNPVDMWQAESNAEDTQRNQDLNIPIKNQAIAGSINLVGARINNIELLKHRKDTSEDSEYVTLFYSDSNDGSYFAELGWITPEKNIELPDRSTIWEASKDALHAGESVTLSWVNREGMRFLIELHLDNNYMFKVKQRVENNTHNTVQVKSYALLNRTRGNDDNSSSIVHEGLIRVLDDKLEEIDYDDMASYNNLPAINGWTGFSDKYWLAALIPLKGNYTNGNLSYNKNHHRRYQTTILSELESIKPGGNADSSLLLFAGAKELSLLDQYQAYYDIPLFDRAVDFGILYFLTKPLFILLTYFYKLIGNFGAAILLLTVVIKALLFPLAYKGFKGMNRIKALQPQLSELQKRYKDDPMKMQKETIALYKREKVNPVSGCLPMILQMPIFFALYKVLYVTLEMRHAPFLGWIKDLSAPDPTSIFNLFGLLPWHTPLFLTIGILPMLMAGSMYLQQRLNPEPTDPTQAKVMRVLPLILLFAFSSFPSGLVLYWAWSNTLSIIQQLVIRALDKK